MKTQFVVRIAAALAVISASASAQVTKYGDISPTGNYAPFVSALTGVTTINFNSQATGALNPTFFPGVTLTGVNSFNTIQNDAGPGQGNTSTGPTSSGEGLNAASPYVLSSTPGSATPSSFTVSFNNGPVGGIGLFLIDLYNPTGAGNNLSFQAFTGVNGTGALLSSFNPVAYNFQQNFRYFVGFTSTTSNIRSFVLTRTSDVSGDAIGVDDITFGSVGSTTVTPEPGSLLLVAAGLAGVTGVVRRRRNNAAPAA